MRGDNVILLGSYRREYSGFLKIKNILHAAKEKTLSTTALPAMKRATADVEECRAKVDHNHSLENAQNSSCIKDANFMVPEENVASDARNLNISDLLPSHYIPKSEESAMKSERKQEDLNREEKIRTVNDRSELRPTNDEVSEMRIERRIRKRVKIDDNEEDCMSIPADDKRGYLPDDSTMRNEEMRRSTDRGIKQGVAVGVKAAQSVQKRVDPCTDTETSSKRPFSTYVQDHPRAKIDSRKEEEGKRGQSEYADQDVRLSLDKAIGTFRSHCSRSGSNVDDSRLDTEEDGHKRREGGRDGTSMRDFGPSRFYDNTDRMASGRTEKDRRDSRSGHVQERTQRSTENMKRDDGLHYFDDTSYQPRKQRKESPRRGSDWGSRDKNVPRRDQR